MRHVRVSMLLILMLCTSISTSHAAPNRTVSERYVKEALASDRNHYLTEFYSDRWDLLRKVMVQFEDPRRFYDCTAISAALDKAVQADPGNPSASYYRGLVLLFLGKTEEAKAQLNKAVSQNPKSAKAYWARAACHKLLNLHTDAIRDYTTCMTMFSEPPVDQFLCHLYRGREYMKARKLDEALADASICIKLKPDSPEAYLLRYETYKRKGDGDLASYDKSKYLKFRNDELFWQENRFGAIADFEERHKTDAEMRAYFEKITAQNPYDEEAFYKYAHWLFRKNEKVEARKYLDVALSLDARYGQALDLKEKIAMATGDQQGAVAARNQREWSGFSDVSRQQNIELAEGLKARNSGDLSQAMVHFSKAIQIDDSKRRIFGERSCLNFFQNIARLFTYRPPPMVLRVIESSLGN